MQPSSRPWLKSTKPACKAIFLLLCLSLIQLLSPLPLAATHGQAKILILHSYDPELRWTAGINRAMKETLLQHEPNLSIHVEYLDTKRNPAADYFTNYIDRVLPDKLSAHHFEVILTSDNDAFNFLRSQRTNLFAETPAVFCGVNGFTREMLKGHHDITGIAETPAFKETLELARRLHPDRRELIFIGETASVTGQKIDAELRTATENLPTGVTARYWNNLPLEELTQRVVKTGKGQVLFLVSVLHDQSGRVYSYTESIREIRQLAKVPIYGVWDFLLGNGIVGGRLTSARAQGQMAAEKALQILQGIPADTIEVSSGEANRYMFDFKELQRFDIPLDSLPQESIIINRPPEYYRLDKWQFWAGVTIILLLCLSIFLLIRTVTLNKKRELALEERARLASLDAEIGQILTRGAPLRDTLQACLETLIKHTDTLFARIWTLSDEDPTLLEMRASAGLHTRIDGRHRFKRVGKLKVGVIASERRPIVTNKVLGDPLFVDQDWIAREGIEGFAGFPLVLKDNCIGVIAFFSRHHLQQEIQKTMASVADMIAVGIVRHRTEQALQEALREAESGRDKIDAILRSVTDGLIVTDLDKQVILINQAAENLLNIAFDSSCCKPLTQLFEEQPFKQQLLQLFNGDLDETLFEVEHASIPGRFLTLQGTTAEVHRRDGSLSGTVAILRDITRERELDRQKSEFIATAAHELRTPVTTIRGYSELLAGEDHDAPFDTATKREFFGYILEKTDTLEKIIDDLLDLGRVESGRLVMLDKERCEMVTLVKEIVQHHQQETQVHQFELHCPVPHLPLELDRIKIQSVLDNLLSNAVKYSPEGGTIAIRGNLKDGILQVCIEDHGIGLSKEQLDQAFNKFYRVDTSDSGTRGLGLGLTICKGIIEGHGGQIWLESEQGQGTRACFTLPLPPAETD